MDIKEFMKLRQIMFIMFMKRVPGMSMRRIRIQREGMSGMNSIPDVECETKSL